jgi:hypothetical protein
MGKRAGTTGGNARRSWLARASGAAAGPAIDIGLRVQGGSVSRRLRDARSAGRMRASRDLRSRGRVVLVVADALARSIGQRPLARSRNDRGAALGGYPSLPLTTTILSLPSEYPPASVSSASAWDSRTSPRWSDPAAKTTWKAFAGKHPPHESSAADHDREGCDRPSQQAPWRRLWLQRRSAAAAPFIRARDSRASPALGSCSTATASLTASSSPATRTWNKSATS